MFNLLYYNLSKDLLFKLLYYNLSKDLLLKLLYYNLSKDVLFKLLYYNYVNLTGISKENFDELHTYIKEPIRNTPARSTKTSLRICADICITKPWS